jgi:hypothetical protein
MLARNLPVQWLAALLVGAVLGFLVARVVEPAPGPLARVAADAGPARDGAGGPFESGSAADELARVERDERAAAQASAPFVAPKAALARAAASVSPSPSIGAAGTGRVSGSVTTSNGEPLAGVEIRLERTTRGTSLLDPADVFERQDDSDLETWLARSAEAWAQQRFESLSATSGDDGRFEIAGVAEGATYWARAAREGFGFRRTAERFGVRAGDEIEFVATRYGAVRVRLVATDGTPLDEGAVVVRRDTITTAYAWRADAPLVPLGPGGAVLRGHAALRDSGSVSAERIDSRYASPETHVRVVGGETLDVELVVAPRLGIRGRVLARGDVLAAGVRVRATPVVDPSADVDALLRAEDQREQRNGLDFAFLDLEPGSWAVGALGNEAQVLARTVVVVEDSAVDVELDCGEPVFDVVELSAVDPAGVPVVGFEVSLDTLAGKRRNRVPLTALSWEGGVGRFLAPRSLAADEERPEPFEASVTASHPAYGRTSVELPRGARTALLRFEEPGSIEVVVEGLAGSDQAGRLWCTVAPAAAKGSDDPFANRGSEGPRQLGPDGRSSFDMLAPGNYRVTLLVGQRAWALRPLESRDVLVTSGDSAVAFALPTLHQVAIVAPALPAGANVWLMSAPGDAKSGAVGAMAGGGQLDANHRVVISDVTPGRYVVTIESASSTLEINVPCGEVLFDARPPDALRVTISDVDGLLYRAGLRSGDLIVAVAGRDPGSADLLREEIFAGTPGVELALTVLRDGERLQCAVVPPDPESAKGALGGRLAGVHR